VGESPVGGSVVRSQLPVVVVAVGTWTFPYPYPDRVAVAAAAAAEVVAVETWLVSVEENWRRHLGSEEWEDHFAVVVEREVDSVDLEGG